jgi:hypothetical protein
MSECHYNFLAFLHGSQSSQNLAGLVSLPVGHFRSGLSVCMALLPLIVLIIASLGIEPLRFGPCESSQILVFDRACYHCLIASCLPSLHSCTHLRTSIIPGSLTRNPMLKQTRPRQYGYVGFFQRHMAIQSCDSYRH